jgi:hypothetical protein
LHVASVFMQTATEIVIRSRAMRIALAALCAIALAAAAVFVAKTEQSITAQRAAVRSFDLHAREATDALAELRTAQQAYVAVGQGPDFWMSKVDATRLTIGSTLTMLWQSAASAGSKSALDEAVAAFADFGTVDRRIREYLSADAQLMAADIIFTEGGEAAAHAAHGIEKARLEELVAFDTLEASRRKQAALAAGGAAALVLLTLVLLALMPAAAAPVEAISIGQTAPVEASAPAVSDARGDDLVLRRIDQSENNPTEGVLPSRPIEPARSVAALKAAAELCTDIGRVNNLEDLKSLLGRSAELLDATGLVLWLASESGAELRPAAAHGYPAQTVARIPAVSRSADNAAAAAYRTSTLQIVLSRPGSSAKGAVVAPVLSADGCIGVLAAEVRDGAEASDTIQALAAILAAQLAGVVGAPPPQYDERASGGAAV